MNNASFRQRLGPISKNILTRQNPLELVFEDISKFDAENPIAGSLLREIDIKKKQSDSDFTKSLPSHPGKEFEIQKRLDALRENKSNNFKRNNNNNNNNNNSGSTGPSLFDRSNDFGVPPSLPTIEDFLDGGTRPPQPSPPPPPSASSLFETKSNPFAAPPTNFNLNNSIVRPPTSFESLKGIGNNLFGSQAAEAVRENKTKTKAQDEIDDFLYEMPENVPKLNLGDGFLNSLGTQAEDLFNNDAPPTKKDKEEEILQKIMDEYEIEKIRDTMDEQGKVPESIYFFYGGDSDQFNNALEFLGLSPINREFDAFLMSDLGLETMTQNKLSIHVDSGNIFYDNHNTGENFYNFLLSQQNDEAAYVPKKCLTARALRNIFQTFCSNSLLMIKKNLIY